LPKKPKPVAAAVEPLAAQDFEGVPVIAANAGDTLTVTVDVENPSDPYLVMFRKKTLMIGQVDREESSPDLPAGTLRLSWSFLHRESAWSHRIMARVGNGADQVLDERSEAKKDPPYTIGVALVVVS
jgi:hypothetical protein